MSSNLTLLQFFLFHLTLMIKMYLMIRKEHRKITSNKTMKLILVRYYSNMILGTKVNKGNKQYDLKHQDYWTERHSISEQYQKYVHM